VLAFYAAELHGLIIFGGTPPDSPSKNSGRAIRWLSRQFEVSGASV
jgi:hypothetical protein